MAATYDDIADWYEDAFLPAQAGDPLEFDRLLPELLGRGTGRCLELGCGTGAHAARIRALGRTPVGVDLSAGMLRRSRGRLPAVRADAERLPVPDGAVPAVASIMVHTDMQGYPAVLREAARVLEPGGVFLHIGVHPCFCGGFADRGEPDVVTVGPGYLDGHWTTASYTVHGVRDKVGARHWPLPALLGMIVDAGFTLERFAEGGAPVPTVLGIRARLGRRRPAERAGVRAPAGSRSAAAG